MKSKSLALTALLLILAGVSVAVYFLAQGEQLSLIAKGAVSVYDTADSSMASPPAKSIAVLQPEQSAPVLRCIDVKHYQIYKVRLGNGGTGYVNAGDYVLVGKDGKRSSC